MTGSLAGVSRNSDIPVPEQAKDRPFQKGFLVPAVTAMRDDEVTAKFGQLDGLQAVKMVCERRCQMCGNDITEDEDVCLLGGIERAYYWLEPPLHVACARYSMLVCPLILSVKDKFGVMVCRDFLPVRVEEYQVAAVPADGVMYTYDQFMEMSAP